MADVATWIYPSCQNWFFPLGEKAGHGVSPSKLDQSDPFGHSQSASDTPMTFCVISLARKVFSHFHSFYSTIFCWILPTWHPVVWSIFASARKVTKQSLECHWHSENAKNSHFDQLLMEIPHAQTFFPSGHNHFCPEGYIEVATWSDLFWHFLTCQQVMLLWTSIKFWL